MEEFAKSFVFSSVAAETPKSEHTKPLLSVCNQT